MNQDFLNWQEAVHILHWVCTGKRRGWWRLVDLACQDKNIVRQALLTVFRGWGGHSSTPVRPPWQWLALFFSFPGPLCRWPACWRCQHKSGCSPRHNRSGLCSRWSSFIPHKEYSRQNLYGCFISLHDGWGLSKTGLPAPVRWWMSLWCWWRKSGVSFELLTSAWPTLHEAKPVSCHCILKYSRMKGVYHRKQGALISA